MSEKLVNAITEMDEDQALALTKELCEVVGKGGGFIMQTEVGEMEGNRPENVRAWIDATREFGVY